MGVANGAGDATCSARSRRPRRAGSRCRGDKIYYNRTSRDLKRIDIVEADTTTGESRVVIPERSNTYIELQPLRLINGGKQAIHWSERDGWGHYYLYDTATGKLIRQITSGEFVCTGIEGVDEKTRTMYFNAAGREPGEDPYFVHLYRVNIDTGDMKLLDPGNASHSTDMNDKGTFFVDNSSRVDSAPESVLYDAAGNEGHGSREDRRLHAPGGRLQVSRALHGEGRRRHHGSRTGRCTSRSTSIRRRSTRSSSTCIPGRRPSSVTKTFSPRSANVALANVGFIVHRGRQPRRQPAAVEVVPQLRLRQPARLRRAGQEGGGRAARQEVRLDRSRAASASTATRAAAS